MMFRDRRRAARPALAPEVSSALADLDRLARDRPELAGACRVVGRMLPALFGGGPTAVPDFAPHREAIREGWSRGLPAFRVVPPATDGGRLTERAVALCDVLEPENPSATAVRIAIRRGRLDPSAAARAALAGETAASPDLGLDPVLVGSVLRLVLLPDLAAASAALAGTVGIAGWPGGACPHCGEPPCLAESRGLEQSRFARCLACASEWPTGRLRCATCGTADPSALRYEAVEGEEGRCRVDVCDACGARLKVVATLGPLSAPGLLVAELATLHLDWLERVSSGVEGARDGGEDRPDSG